VDDQELVRREIEDDPYYPGPSNARLRRSGVHVWAIIGYYLHAVGGDEQAVARDYGLSPDEVKAALGYYRYHRAEIEGRIAEIELSLSS
jgi:uncharacterized protein (DUF433 family)